MVVLGFGFTVFMALLLIGGPSERVLRVALLVGLIMTTVNCALNIGASRLNLWSVRGAWRLFGYPFSMVLAWFFLIACFCLVIDRLHFLWSRAIFVALAGIGGSIWDLGMHTRAGILTLGRARKWHVVVYWVALAFIAALLFILSERLL